MHCARCYNNLMGWRQFLDQKPAPVGTAIVAATVVIYWAAMALIHFMPPLGWNRLILVPLALVGFIAFIVSVVAGAIAVRRGEYLSGWIAVIGVASWPLAALCFSSL